MRLHWQPLNWEGRDLPEAALPPFESQIGARRMAIQYEPDRSHFSFASTYVKD